MMRVLDHDLRSECEPCEDTEMDLDTALRCPMPVHDVLDALKAGIQCDEDDQDAERSSHILPFEIDPAAYKALRVDGIVKAAFEAYAKANAAANGAVTTVALSVRGEYAPAMLQMVPGGSLDVPLFHIGVGLVMVCCAMQQPACVVLPAHHLGMPGTTLTLRRALRCLLDSKKNQCISFEDITGLLKNVRGALW